MNRLPPTPPALAPSPGPAPSDVPFHERPAWVKKTLGMIDASLAGNPIGVILKNEAIGNITHEAARELIAALHAQWAALVEFTSTVRTNDELRPSVN